MTAHARPRGGILEFRSTGFVYFLQLTALLSYSEMWYAGPDRAAGLLAFAVGCALAFALNAACFSLVTGRRTVLVSLSPFIICTVLANVIHVRSLTPFLCAVVVAILSKFFLRLRGRHVFNPGNFANVLLFVFTAEKHFTFQEHASPLFVSYAWALGLVVSLLAGRAFASLSYLGAVSALRALLPSSLPPFGGFAGVTQIVLPIFTFHAITDPATSPSGRREQLVFGLSVALVEALLAVLRVPFGQAIGLTTACLVYSVYLATRAQPVAA